MQTDSQIKLPKLLRNKRSCTTPAQSPPRTRPELLFDKGSCLPPSYMDYWEGELVKGQDFEPPPGSHSSFFNQAWLTVS